jgi:hypothetical protein
LFRDEQDREVFLDMLRFALTFSKCVLWAYALMSNHYHLVLYGSSLQLTRCMTRLKNSYSVYHNRRYGLSGAAFEGPYKAIVQRSPGILARTLAYVVLNPWRAGLRAVSESWLWTSLRAFSGEEAHSPVPVDPLMALLAVDPDMAAARVQYQAAIEAEMARPKPPGGERLTASEIQGRQFDWCLEEAQRRDFGDSGISPEHAAAYWAVLAGVPLRVIVRRLGVERSRVIQRWLDELKDRIRKDTSIASLLKPP